MIKMEEAVGLLVGEPTADSEHLELVLLINLAHAYSKSKEYKSQVPSLVVLFTTKLVSHCQSEESVLRACRSPTLEAHIEEHKKLINVIVPLLEDIDMNTVKRFENMLRRHIYEYDLPGFKS